MGGCRSSFQPHFAFSTLPRIHFPDLWESCRLLGCLASMTTPILQVPSKDSMDGQPLTDIYNSLLLRLDSLLGNTTLTTNSDESAARIHHVLLRLKLWGCDIGQSKNVDALQILADRESGLADVVRARLQKLSEVSDGIEQPGAVRSSSISRYDIS
jgi:hypothetical protein